VTLGSVTGRELNFEAFNIRGNNFFRVRDVAYALSNTPARFGVAWDSATSTIVLTTGTAYASASGMAAPPASPIPRTAYPTTVNFMIDGSRVSLDTYNIGGNNFVRLRDLAAALGTFDVQFIDGTVVIFPGVVYVRVTN
jgi:hypothetical protein